MSPTSCPWLGELLIIIDPTYLLPQDFGFHHLMTIWSPLMLPSNQDRSVVQTVSINKELPDIILEWLNYSSQLERLPWSLTWIRWGSYINGELFNQVPICRWVDSSCGANQPCPTTDFHFYLTIYDDVTAIDHWKFTLNLIWCRFGYY